MDKKTKYSPGVYDSLRKHWNNGVWHFEHLPRRFPGPPPVAIIGWVPYKQKWVHHRFSTANFSLILAGQGSYAVAEGPAQPILCPTLIRQYPGVDVHYGPEEHWCELFLIYPAHSLADWKQRGATNLDHWPIAPSPRVYRLINELLELCHTTRPYQDIDRIDRIAEWLVVESLCHDPQSIDWRAATVDRLRADLERDPMRDWDMVQAALAAGLSVSHFRRLWQRLVGLPPLRYQRALRLQEACRRLVHDSTPIARIAQDCSFPDQLYFARCFRAFTGMTATQYRHRFRDTANDQA